MPHAPTSPAEYWDKYKPYRGEGEQPTPSAETFDWTPYPGHGPGADLLGRCQTALDLGPGEGVEAAYLAYLGVAVTAVDFSAAQVERARRFWADVPGLDFIQAEACAFLDGTADTYDAIYSNWGAAWFTDPADLMPRILRHLNPGGTLVFAHGEPGDTYGPQRMGGPWLEGRDDLTVLRWQYPPQGWADILKRVGFTGIDAGILSAPEAEGRHTLLVCARSPKR